MFGWLQVPSLLSEGDGVGQIRGHAADQKNGSCLVLRPKYLKEETVITKEPFFSSGGTILPTRDGQDTQEQPPLEVPLAVGGISSDQVPHARGPGTSTRLSVKARVQNIHVEGSLGLETHGAVALSGQRSESFKE